MSQRAKRSFALLHPCICRAMNGEKSPISRRVGLGFSVIMCTTCLLLPDGICDAAALPRCGRSQSLTVLTVTDMGFCISAGGRQWQSRAGKPI